MQQFLPLIGIIPKVLPSLDDNDVLALVSTFVGGPQAAELATTLTQNRGLPRDQLLATVLKSQVAQDLINGTHKANEDAAKTILVRCPMCEARFETLLSD